MNLQLDIHLSIIDFWLYVNFFFKIHWNTALLFTLITFISFHWLLSRHENFFFCSVYYYSTWKENAFFYFLLNDNLCFCSWINPVNWFFIWTKVTGASSWTTQAMSEGPLHWLHRLASWYILPWRRWQNCLFLWIAFWHGLWPLSVPLLSSGRNNNSLDHKLFLSCFTNNCCLLVFEVLLNWVDYPKSPF